MMMIIILYILHISSNYTSTKSVKVTRQGQMSQTLRCLRSLNASCWSICIFAGFHFIYNFDKVSAEVPCETITPFTVLNLDGKALGINWTHCVKYQPSLWSEPMPAIALGPRVRFSFKVKA